MIDVRALFLYMHVLSDMKILVAGINLQVGASHYMYVLLLLVVKQKTKPGNITDQNKLLLPALPPRVHISQPSFGIPQNCLEVNFALVNESIEIIRLQVAVNTFSGIIILGPPTSYISNERYQVNLLYTILLEQIITVLGAASIDKLGELWHQFVSRECAMQKLTRPAARAAHAIGPHSTNPRCSMQMSQTEA